MIKQILKHVKASTRKGDIYSISGRENNLFCITAHMVKKKVHIGGDS